MKKMVLKIVSMVVTAAVFFGSCAYGAENNGFNAYKLNDDFYVKTSEELTEELLTRIFDYRIAETSTNDKDVIEIVENIGSDIKKGWNEIRITHYNTADIFAGIWGILDETSTEMQEEVLCELMADHSASEVLVSAATQDTEYKELAAAAITRYGKMIITEDVDDETLIFLLNPDCDYNCLVSFYKIADNVMMASITPMSSKTIDNIIGYLESKGCEFEQAGAENESEPAKSEIMESVELSDEAMIETAQKTAERLLYRYGSADYLAAIGVTDSLMDLCIEINEEFDNGFGDGRSYKICSSQVWETMLESEFGNEAVPEEYAAIIEYMKTQPVVENLASQYIAMYGVEMLALSSLVSANNYEIRDLDNGTEAAVIFPGGDKYSILVFVCSSGTGVVSYTAEIVPAEIEEMFKQLETE